MPLISVVIATYQRPEPLKRAVNNALTQTISDLEVVVSIEAGDQASIDAVQSIADARVRYVINPVKRGPGIARDFGVSHATGKWVALLDDDDEWTQDKLERQLAAAGDDDRVVVSCQAHVVTEHGARILPPAPYDPAQPIEEWFFDRRHWLKPRGSFAQTSTLLVPRKLFERVQFGQSRHEDWEFVIRAVKQEEYTLKTVMAPLVRYAAGGTFGWEASVAWVDTVRDLISPRAYSGFCLTIAPRDLPPQSRNQSALRLLRMAFKNGRPTARQLFTFLVLWAAPGRLREQAITRMSREQAS